MLASRWGAIALPPVLVLTASGLMPLALELASPM